MIKLNQNFTSLSYNKGLKDERPRGMAMAVAIALVTVVGVWIMIFNNYQKNKIFITAYEGRVAVVDAACEAALNMAMAELRLNFDFQTQKSKTSAAVPGDSTEFDGPFTPAPDPMIADTDNSEGDPVIDGLEVSQGLYQGTIGDCDFKVKVGRQFSEDNTNSYSVKENIIFLRLEAVAQYKYDPAINRRLFATIAIDNLNKYNYYDGQEANLIFGVSGDTVQNILETGYIYGHNDLGIGTILNNSNQPELILRNVDGIHTGYNGRIHVSTDARVKVEHEHLLPSASFWMSNNGGYEKYSTLASEKNETTIETVSGLLKDRNTGAQDVDLNVNNIRAQAKRLAESGNGITITEEAGGAKITIEGGGQTSVPLVSFSNEGLSVTRDAVKIDFGLMLTQTGDDAVVDENNEKVMDLDYSDTFNGIVYSDVPLVIWGTPDRDMAIYSEKDIHLVGDFNMRTDTSENALGDGVIRFPVQQDYDDEFLHRYIKQTDYEDINGSDEDIHSRAYWNYVDIISEGRIWWDYRDPRYYAENECKPLIAYETAMMLLMPYQGDAILDFCVAVPTPEVMTMHALTDDWLTQASESAYEKLIKFPDTWPPSPASTSALDAWLSQSIVAADSYGITDSVINAVATDTSNDPENFMPLDPIKNYLKRTLLISDESTDAEVVAFYSEILQMLYDQLEDGEWTVAEANAYTDSLWNNGLMLLSGADVSTEAASMLFGRHEPKSLLNRLASLTIAENRSSYPPSETSAGRFSHLAGGSDAATFKNDRFYIPEMSVNAKFKDMGVRNARWDSHPELLTKDNYNSSPGSVFSSISGYVSNHSKAIDTIRKVGTLRSFMGRPPGNSVILRRYGGIVHLRKAPSPEYHGTGYSPPIRRLLFDPNFISKFDLNSFRTATFQVRRIEKDDYDNF